MVNDGCAVHFSVKIFNIFLLQKGIFSKKNQLSDGRFQTAVICANTALVSLIDSKFSCNEWILSEPTTDSWLSLIINLTFRLKWEPARQGARGVDR